ncbi:MAG TPA: hypothetical protein VIV06_12335, partial [Candidatus Limnocylindrales bacterium]
MNLLTLARLLRSRERLRRHERFTRAELAVYQATRLGGLRAFATARSPFYRELHRGLDGAPLAALPIVTKAMLMEHFDDVVTDRAISLTAVERHLRALQDDPAHDRLLRGRYRVVGTGGTTGRRGLFLSDPREWATVLASYARAYEWSGVLPGIRHPVRTAIVSSRDPIHQSAAVGATVASRLVPALRLDATQPLEAIVAELDAFEPDALVGYASMLCLLAEERLAGRLHVAPRAVFSASEVLTDAMRERVRAAFGVAVTNVYGATETAGIASECRLRRMHRYDDLVISEVVDEDGRAVEPGGVGARLLVTVLFARTQPLIRYELSDRVEAIDATCPDGLPFGLIGSIAGREEDTLVLHGVTVHPNVFHGRLESLAVAGWQVIDEGDRLRLLLARPAPT